MFDFGPFLIRPGAAIVWQSRKMADYDLSVDAFLFFSRNWALFSRSDFLFYDHGIKSSPIIRKGRSNSFIMGIVYVF